MAFSAVARPASARATATGAWPPARRARSLFDRYHWVLALALFVAGALVMQRHALAHIGTQIAGNVPGDPTQYMWAMWWWPHAILSGDNPFVTHAIWYPNAYNLASVTATPLPSILFAPFNALVGWTHGPVISYNVCNLLAPILSAWFTYRLCLHLSGRPAAAIAGGWFYGFSVYGLSQLQGHLNLVFGFLPVVLILLVLKRLEGAVGRRRFVVLGAVAIAAQIGVGTEIVFTTTCLGVVGLVIALLLAPSPARGRLLRTIIPELAGAYLLAAIVCSPYLYYALTGPAVNAGYNSRFNIADLLSYVVPTPLVRLGEQKLLGVAQTFPAAAGFGETGTYLGLPLLVGAGAYAVGAWRRWPAKVMVLMAAVACLWSLGPVLTIDGQSTIWLPWSLLDDRHAFNQISPVRVGMYVELAAAIAFALWLAQSSRWWPTKWLLALLAAAFLFPNVNGSLIPGKPIYSESVASPAFITTGAYRRQLTHNEVILPIPFGPFGNSLLWQAQTRGYFRLASGWFGYYPPDYGGNAFISQLLGFSTFTDPYRLARQFLVSHHVGAVVVVNGLGGNWLKVLSQLGLAPVQVGGVAVYRVPASLTAA